MNTLNEKITDLLEANDISLCGLEEQDGRCWSEMEWYTPEGEDFIFTVWFDGTDADFIRKFAEYAADFDPDEHAEMWVDSRGKNGVPNSIRALIDDADAIKKMLRIVAADLAELTA